MGDGIGERKDWTLLFIRRFSIIFRGRSDENQKAALKLFYFENSFLFFTHTLTFKQLGLISFGR
jgi:hypothetical protein